MAERRKLLGTSLGIFPPTNTFRKFCAAWARNPTWEGFILVSIIVSSLLLAIDGPTADKTSETGKQIWAVIDQVDFAFIVLFTLEALLKIVATGLFCESEDGYLKSTWNLLGGWGGAG